jgi:predicted CXXCH cytochrome family protein
MRYADEVKWQMAICAASVAAACRNPVTVAVGVAATPQTKSNILRSDYVGSAACKPCHADVFAKWITSPMHKMTRDPAEAEIRAPFAGEIFAFKDDRVDLFRAGDGRFMRLHSDKQPDRLFRVTRVIGNHYREDFAGVEVSSTDDRVARGSGNEQILPVTYYFESRGYRPKGYSVMTPERPGLFAGGVWNQTCIFCHNTVPGLDSLLGALAGPSPPGYQGVTVDHLLPPDRRFVYRVTREEGFRAAVADEVGLLGEKIAESGTPTSVARSGIHAMANHFRGENLVEEGIGCEACHGGSREHAANPKVSTSYGPVADFLSVEPADSSAPTRALLINRTCARCHQVLFSRYPFTWEGGLRHSGTPGGSSGTSGEARDLLLSGPARNLPCTACHDPHAPDRPEHLAALATPAGNSVCLPCHSSLATAQSLAEHSHHKPDGPAGACIACHMPRKNMALTYSLTRYHRIGSPTDRARVEGDRPIECALCHVDKSVVSLVDASERWWNKHYDRARLQALYGDLESNALVATLERGRPHEQVAAAMVLAEHKVKSAAPKIAPLLLSSYPLARRFAAQALASLLDQPCVVDVDADPETIRRTLEKCGISLSGLTVAVPSRRKMTGQSDED